MTLQLAAKEFLIGEIVKVTKYFLLTGTLLPNPLIDDMHTMPHDIYYPIAFPLPSFNLFVWHVKTSKGKAPNEVKDDPKNDLQVMKLVR